jgi:hypothetical protein
MIAWTTNVPATALVPARVGNCSRPRCSRTQSRKESLLYAERYVHLVINSRWTPILVGEVVNLSRYQLRK